MDFNRGDKDLQLQRSWIPATPGKPYHSIPHQIYENRQEKLANWVGSESLPSGFSQGNQGHRLDACFDSTNTENRGVEDSWEVALGRNAGIYEASVDWHNMPLLDLLAQVATGSTTQQVESGSAFSRNFHGFSSSNQDLSLGSNLHGDNNCSEGVRHYAYDLNAPPGTIADEGPSKITQQFVPATLGNSKQGLEVTDERENQDNNHKETNEVAVTRVENNKLHSNKELSHMVEDSSINVVSTPLKGNHDLDMAANNGIDLNRTPEQKPRRRKHRPKVVTEGKPKRIRKPAVPKSDADRPKRKYVRKNGLNKASTTPTPDAEVETADPKTLQHTAKSCKKALNFDLDSQDKDGRSSARAAFNLNLESEEPPSNTGGVQPKPTVQISQGMELVEDSPGNIAYKLACSAIQGLNHYISLSPEQVPSTPPAWGKPKACGQNEKGTEVTGQTTAFFNNTHSVTSPNDSNCSTSCSAEGQARGKKRKYSRTIDHADPSTMNATGTEYNSMQSYCPVWENALNNRTTGMHFPDIYKKKRTEKGQISTTGSMSSFMTAAKNVVRRVTESHDKNDNPSPFAPITGCWIPIPPRSNTGKAPAMSEEAIKCATELSAKNANPSSFAPRFDGWIPGPRYNTGKAPAASGESIRCATERQDNNAKLSPFAPSWISVPNFNTAKAMAISGEEIRQGRQNNVQAFQCMMALNQKERLTKKRSKAPTRLRDVASLIGIAKCNSLPTLPTKQAPSEADVQVQILQRPNTIEALVAETRATLARKKRTRKGKSIISSFSSTDKEVQLYNHHISLVKSIGPSPKVMWEHMFPVEEIVERLKRLNINGECYQCTYQEHNAIVQYKAGYQQKQNALVPYNMKNALVPYERDGTVVPFEGRFNPVKKRRPRPKVDLDEETNKVWKLLMWNINSEGVDGTDEEKSKWWESERKVFNGRADSFIARMHLVQGDRRFSRWKGSVVDSVVGVFLTQNVSDHLSSSAFMSMAAHFPLKRNNQPCYEEDTSTLMEEPRVCIVDLDDNSNWNEKMSNNPICDQSSMTLHEPEHNEEKEVVNSEEILRSRTGGLCSTIDSEHKSDAFGSNPAMFCELTMNRSVNQIMEIGRSCFAEDRMAMEDFISSQTSVVSTHSSVDSSVAQSGERMGSFSESNSEVQVPAFGSFMELLNTQMAEGYSHGSGHVASAKSPIDVPIQSDCMGYDQQTPDMHRLDDLESSLEASVIPSNSCSHLTPDSGILEVEDIELFREESRSTEISKKKNENRMSEQSGLTGESSSPDTIETNMTVSTQESQKSSRDNVQSCNNIQRETNGIFMSQRTPNGEPANTQNSEMQQKSNLQNYTGEVIDLTESTWVSNNQNNSVHTATPSNLKECGHSSDKAVNEVNANTSKAKRGRVAKEKNNNTFDWDSLRREAQANGRKRERTANTMDSLDWEAVRCADVNEIANTIKERGMNNMLAERIKDFLNRLVREHGSIDLEWLRDVPPDKAKEYLLSVRGLGLKSVECVRLLTLHHLAFPVDTNVGRIVVRLGWVPLQPLPESLQLHLLELYPVLESIQKYLWPRLCKLDQRTLYELHYQMITFGKVFCTKNRPNCNACPMRGECRHFASAFASARLALPGPEEKSMVNAAQGKATEQTPPVAINQLRLPQPRGNQQSERELQIEAKKPLEENKPSEAKSGIRSCEPIIEEPATPEPEKTQITESDIEDAFCEDPNEIPTIELNFEKFTQNVQNYMEQNMELQEGEMSKALVALTPEAASLPTPKLKNVSRLRTEHHVYELPDSHPLLQGLDKREPDDPCSYLLAIWTPGETASSIQPPEGKCNSQETGQLCNESTCFSCNSIREANSQTVRGTLLIPCRTAMRGSFPLNGTYFQVNEVFADHDSSLNPIDVPRSWLWNLPRRTVYFGTSIPTIFKGLTTEGIQYCFWRGFVCVRGFDQKSRAPRPLMARLHFPASKLAKGKGKANEE